MRASLLVLVALGAACEDGRPEAMIICHNSNCGHSDPARDCTMEALSESLALRYQDRASIDGLEMDVIWDAPGQRCVFEHDHADAASAPELLSAVSVVADHLREHRDRASWNGERFYFKLELKSGAAPEQVPLSAHEIEGLVDCALAATELMEAAGAEAGVRVTTIYDSVDLQLLRSLDEGAAWQADLAGPRQARQVSVPWKARPSEDLLQWVGVASIYWRQVHDGDYTLLRDLEDHGIDAMVSMFDAGEETLETIAYSEPTYVSTNEAPLFRQWLAPGW